MLCAGGRLGIPHLFSQWGAVGCQAAAGPCSASWPGGAAGQLGALREARGVSGLPHRNASWHLCREILWICGQIVIFPGLLECLEVGVCVGGCVCVVSDFCLCWVWLGVPGLGQSQTPNELQKVLTRQAVGLVWVYFSKNLQCSALQSALQSRSSTAFALRPDSQTRPLSFSVAVPQPEHRHIMSNSSSFFMCFAGSPSRDCGMFYSSSGFLYTKEKPHHSLSWLGSSLWWISSLRLCEALLPLGLLTLLGCVRDGHCAWDCKRAAQLGVFSCQADGLTLLFVSFEWTALRNNCTDEVYVFYLVLIFLFT